MGRIVVTSLAWQGLEQTIVMAGEIASRSEGTTGRATEPALPAVGGQAGAENATQATVATTPARSGLLHPADRSMLITLFVVVVISVGLRLLTWNPMADGAHVRYVKTALFGGFAAAAVWFL